MKKLSILIILGVFLFSYSQKATAADTTQTFVKYAAQTTGLIASNTSQTTPNKPETATPDEKRLDVPLVYSAYNEEPALCYLGAYGMAAKYKEPGLDFSDIVVYSDAGADVKYWGGGFISNHVEDASMIIASKNLGFEYVLGLGKDGVDSDYDLDLKYRFKDHAKSIEYFDGSVDALNFLKKAIASDNPPVVCLDMYYLVDPLGAQSPCGFWKYVPKKHNAHYMLVTGYDQNKIYLNDPTCSSAKNMGISISDFLTAWQSTKDLPDANLGPYWCIYLVKAGDKKSVTDVLEMIKSDNDAASELKKFADHGEMMDISCFKFNEFAKARLELSKFLEKHGKQAAADKYKEISDMYATVCSNSDPNQVLATIANLETEALNSI